MVVGRLSGDYSSRQRSATEDLKSWLWVKAGAAPPPWRGLGLSEADSAAEGRWKGGSRKTGAWGKPYALNLTPQVLLKVLGLNFPSFDWSVLYSVDSGKFGWLGEWLRCFLGETSIYLDLETRWLPSKQSGASEKPLSNPGDPFCLLCHPALLRSERHRPAR